MTSEQFEKFRKTVRAKLEAALKRATDVTKRVEAAQASLQASEGECRELMERMDRASARVPLGQLAYRYAKGLQRAGGPVALPDGSLSDEFEEIPEEKVEELKRKYMRPAIEALEAVYPTARDLLTDVQNQALMLRYFSDSEALLERYAAVLAQPWFDSVNLDDLMPRGTFRLHWFYATLPHRTPPHLWIIARRRACTNSLTLLESKLKALKSLVETSLTELGFAQQREVPAAVPVTWNDYSVRIGEGSKIEGSAIGQQSSVESQ